MGDEYGESELNGKIKRFFQNITVLHIVLFAIVIFVIIGLQDNESYNPKYNYIIYAVLIGIVLISYFKPTIERKIIPEHVAKNIANEALYLKVREGKEFSYDSKVVISGACHLKYENDMITGNSGPISWDIGFIEYVQGSKYGKEGVIRIHPYDGRVTGISWYPLGYTGRESRDKEIIPVGVVQGDKPSEYKPVDN